MKNITVSLDDETYRRARVAAAEAGRSVTSVVREFLQGYSAEPASDCREKTLEELYAEIDARPRRADSYVRMTRDELYDEMLSERSR